MPESDTEDTSLIKYVDELASPEEYPPGDAWVSVTDAGRITRSSDAMARRWVAKGLLPIKREPVGINARTRLVRVSDVAKIRPILDISAAITDDTRKLDLPAIPRQMAEIEQQQQQIIARAAEIDGLIQQLTTTLQEQAAAFTQAQAAHAEQESQARTELQAEMLRHWQQANQALEAAELLREAEKLETVRQLTKMMEIIKDQDQAITDFSTETRDRLTRELNELEQRLNTRTDRLINALEGQLKASQSTTEAALERIGRETAAATEQRAGQLRQEIETLRGDQARDLAGLTSKVEQLTTAQTTAASTSQGQAQRIQQLQNDLNTERQARLALEKQVKDLAQLVQQLQKGGEAKKK